MTKRRSTKGQTTPSSSLAVFQ